MIHIIDLNFQNKKNTIAAFLIENAGELALVETGPFSTFQTLKKGVEAAGYSIDKIKKVFLTHIHFDHAGAAWHFAQNGATIYVHPRGLKHLAEPAKLYESAKLIYQDKMQELWGDMNAIEEKMLYAPQDGEKIKFGNTELVAHFTPGHAVHHIAWQFGDDLFCGDVAGVKIETGIVVPPCPPPDINVEDWLKSIDAIKKLKVKRLHLVHYGTVVKVRAHLESLSKRLVRWTNFVKKQSDKGLSAETITPLYVNLVKKELERYGANTQLISQYESANPAWMSVLGIMRYCKKKENIYR